MSIPTLTLQEILFNPDNGFVTKETGDNITTYTLINDIVYGTDVIISDVNTDSAIISSNTVFDGNNKTIKIDTDDDDYENEDFRGLFKTTYTLNDVSSYPENITIKNIGVLRGYQFAFSGYICASEFGKYAKGDILIDNCYSTGEINYGGIVGNGFGSFAGSTLTGSRVINITIQNCYSTGDLRGIRSGGITSNQYASSAGYQTPAGITVNMTIRNCYSTGGIYSGSGGICGGNLGNNLGNETAGEVNLLITNCYSTGILSDFNSSGIISPFFASNAGTLSTGSINMTISNCYSQTSTAIDGANGILGSLTTTLSGNMTINITNVFAVSQKYTQMMEMSTNEKVIISGVQTNINEFINDLGTDTEYWDTNVVPYPTLVYYTTPANNTPQVTQIYASSSGDPHVYPVYGSMYELPNETEGIYRMIEGDNIILNASTKKLNKIEKNDIIRYCNRYGVLNEYGVDKIVTSGVFYDKIFINSDGNKCWYDFNKKQMEMTKKSKEYFKVSTEKIERGCMLYGNEYEKSESVMQLTISFNHSKYGLMRIELNYFSNPQIKYGIGMSCKKTKELSGLLIREYINESMECLRLDEVEKKKGKVGKNKKTSDIILVKKKCV